MAGRLHPEDTDWVRFSRTRQRPSRDAGLRRLRLATASWVAISTSAAGVLVVTNALHALIVAAAVAALLGLTVVAILTTAEQRAERRREQAEAEEAEIPVIDLPLRDRLGLIERIWGQRIVNGLDRSLQHAVEIQLGLREAPELLRLSYAVTPGRSGDPINLFAAYERARHQFVILGPPGSGKTTQALLLMRHLLDIARRDPSATVPEVFQLPSWARERKPLLEWLTDELRRRHGYRSSLGRSLLVHHRIVPVLDGLDEVAREHRDECVTKITEFWESHRSGPLVLCSRLKEYEELPERVPFGGAVTIDPPSDEQIQCYLEAAGPQWDPVRTSLATGSNQALRELLLTPLLLSVAVLAYRDRDPGELCVIHDAITQAHRLWACYVEQMRTRRYDPVLPSTPPYTEEQMLSWLGWLASAMRDANESELWLHEWLGPPAFHRGVHLVSRLLVGLLVGLDVGLLVGLGGGLVVGLGAGLVVGLGGALLVGLGGALFTRPSQPAYRVPFDLLKVVVGLVDSEPDRSRLAVRKPTQLIADSARLGLVVGLVAGLVVGLGAGLVFFGMGAVVGHYVYRFLLWRRRWAPLRWPRFIDWACSHLYLRSTGPAYQWVHIELRDHLADAYAARHTPSAAG